MSAATEIKASEVQRLRLATGAGLMDCKQALVETKGDFEKAAVLLREKGIAKSSKRADRVAAEGLIDSWLSPDQKDGIILELNSETDFVARNPEFSALGKALMATIQKHPDWTTADQAPQEEALALSGKMGEKISLKRFTRYTPKTGGLVAAYIHHGAKLGVLLEITSDKSGAPSEDLKNLGRELALQVAGANPTYVSQKDVPAAIVTQEKEIAKKQMEGTKKPPEVLEKIATGKLQQFYEANCLLDQAHVKDASGKTKIQSLVDAVSKKDGSKLTVTRFVRFRVGAE